MLTSAQRTIIDRHCPGNSTRDALRRQALQRLTLAGGSLDLRTLSERSEINQLALTEVLRDWLLVVPTSVHGVAGYRLCVLLHEQLLGDIEASEPAQYHTPQAARLNGYDGRACPRCHERRTVHSGTEHACDACGNRWSEKAPADPLAAIRAIVARATNVATIEDAHYAASLPPLARFRHAPALPAQDCAGVAV